MSIVGSFNVKFRWKLFQQELKQSYEILSRSNQGTKNRRYTGFAPVTGRSSRREGKIHPINCIARARVSDVDPGGVELGGQGRSCRL